MSPTPVRIAIVGGGPKCLYALESLSAALQSAAAAGHRPRLHVDVYEEATPGAGRIWDPAQPDVFVLNVTSAIISAWPAQRSASTRARRSFAEWADVHAPQHRLDPFPPRSVVGAYLAWAFDLVCAELPETMTVSVIPARVRRLSRAESTQSRAESTQSRAESAQSRAGSTWQVHAAGHLRSDPTASGPARSHSASQPATAYDEVLLATGHARRHSLPLITTDLHTDARTLRYDDYATIERIAPGQRVLVSGAALTFIDFALMVTENRCGHFERNVVTGDLIYRACGAEPVLVPTAPSGRFLNAKPPSIYTPAAGGAQLADLDAIIAHHAGRLPDDADPTQVGAALRRCAVDILTGWVGGSETAAAAEAVAAVAETAATGWGPDLGRSAKAALERSVLVARGLHAPDAECALGQAWTGLLPRIREVLSFREHDPEQWREFLGLSARLMRFAEGPPLINAEKTLALIRAGVIDLEMMGPRSAEHTSHKFGHPDLHVMAVLAPPGAVHARTEVVDSLIAEGVVARPCVQRGIRVSETLQVLDPSGVPVPGLSAVGRLTEDWTIANDSLNRDVLPEPDAWAQRIVSTAS